MTAEQRQTINLLRARGYSTRVVRRAAYGCLLVRLRAQLITGNIPLRVYPDGHYVCPWYDSHNATSRRGVTWHN